MRTQTILVLICFSLIKPLLFGQTNAPADSANTTTPPVIPEEARKHFVMGTALFKDAKTPDDYVQVVGEFKQATDLAPQWPDPRYNLALAKEASGDYSGAEADLKIYQQFKLSDTEARSVQDKIYVLEAKLEKKSAAYWAEVNAAADKAKATAKAKADADAAKEKAKRAGFINSISGDWKSGSYSITIEQYGDDNLKISARDESRRALAVSDFSLHGAVIIFSIHTLDGTGWPDRLLRESISLQSNGHLEGIEDSYWSEEAINRFHISAEKRGTRDVVFIRQ